MQHVPTQQPLIPHGVSHERSYWRQHRDLGTVRGGRYPGTESYENKGAQEVPKRPHQCGDHAAL